MHLKFFKDARYFQIIFQCIFLSYGIICIHCNTNWWLYAIYIGVSLSLQFLIEFFTSKKYDSWKSALISALGLCLLLQTNHWTIAVFAAVITIASKYIFRFNHKHIFNPSAFGITATVLFTNDAWISPGQWGNSVVLLFAVLSLGFIIVTKVQKLDVSIAFLGTFSLLLFVRQIFYLGWPMDFFIQSISTGSLLLFSFFMITDPKTTPNHFVARIIWCVLVAAISFYLSAFKFINGAPVWVLVFAQPLVPVLDGLFKGKIFEWKKTTAINMAGV